MVKIIIIIWLCAIIGWIANIYQVLVNIPATFGEMTPMFIIKGICVFFVPIGSVLGWIGMFF